MTNFSQMQDKAQAHDLAVERCKQWIGGTTVNAFISMLNDARLEADSANKQRIKVLIAAIEDNIDEAAEYLA